MPECFSPGDRQASNHVRAIHVWNESRRGALLQNAPCIRVHEQSAVLWLGGGEAVHGYLCADVASTESFVRK